MFANPSVLSFSVFPNVTSLITNSPSNNPFRNVIKHSLVSSLPKIRLKAQSTRGIYISCHTINNFMGHSRNIAFLPQIYDFILKPPRIFEDYLYYGNYNFSYYSFFLRGYKGLKVVTICYYKYLYINIYNYIFIYTFLYLHFKSVILGQNKTVITEIVICNRFFSGIEMHTFIAPKTMTISSQSYEL